MYCASTVYVYMAKEDSKSFTPIDRANLEVIIQAMEAIGRTHKITLAFLQQACLDVERNNLAADIRLPNLKQYRDIFAGAGSNIPLLARVAIARHTKVSPVLPGRLPLGKPEGCLRPLHMRLDQAHLEGTIPELGPEDEGTPCFRAMLGAVTRSVNPELSLRRQAAAQSASTKYGGNETSATNDRQKQKRRRVSPSPGPEDARNLNRAGTYSTSSGGQGRTGHDFSPSAMSGASGTSNAHSTYSRFPAQHANVAAVLPDRTNSSTSSSPMNHISIGTETQTQSSHTSPGVLGFGLGNTAEENRVDLRSLQDRVSTPIWDQEILNSMNGGDPLHANYGGDPWGIMGADVDWDGQVTTG
jgi:hypothetical protein